MAGGITGAEIMKSTTQWLNGIVLITGLIGPGLDARAQDRPVMAPSRDVTVTYALTGGAQNQGATTMRVTYADGNKRVRMDLLAFPDAKVAFGSIIFDTVANEVLSLLPDQQAYYVLPAAGKANPGLLLNDKMQYIRQGKETIADLPCTDWMVSNGTDFQGTACVTADGVALRATRTLPKPGTMEAVKVSYGTPPGDTFKPPPDLKLKPTK
jgi:hypothetical protein